MELSRCQICWFADLLKPISLPISAILWFALGYAKSQCNFILSLTISLNLRHGYWLLVITFYFVTFVIHHWEFSSSKSRHIYKILFVSWQRYNHLDCCICILSITWSCVLIYSFTKLHLFEKLLFWVFNNVTVLLKCVIS